MSSSAPFLIPDIRHHSLQSTWTFSYCFPPRSPDIKIDQWERYLHYFTDFSSFEDFYGIINSIEKPSQLPVGCRYYVFRKGIKPIWEDLPNKNGYEFSVEYDNVPSKGKSKGKPKDRSQMAEDRWMDLTLSILTENIPNNDKINGIEFFHRKYGFRVGVWTKNLNDKEKIELEQTIKKLLGQNPPPLASIQLSTAPANKQHQKENKNEAEIKKETQTKEEKESSQPK